MTQLYVVKDEDGSDLWVAAVIGQDVWTYVTNTARFHRNDGARHDFFFLNELEYREIGVAEAQRLITAGVGTVDEADDPDSAQQWREDQEAIGPDVVFASITADPR